VTGGVRVQARPARRGTAPPSRATTRPIAPVRSSGVSRLQAAIGNRATRDLIVQRKVVTAATDEPTRYRSERDFNAARSTFREDALERIGELDAGHLFEGARRAQQQPVDLLLAHVEAAVRIGRGVGPCSPPEGARRKPAAACARPPGDPSTTAWAGSRPGIRRVAPHAHGGHA